MVGATTEPRTLAEKVWDAHVVRSADGEPDLLYIDLHLLHEVTSPQAFDGLRMAGRRGPQHADRVRRPGVQRPPRRPAHDRRPGVPDPDRDPATQLRRVRREA